MLTANIWQEVGLFNGAPGTIHNKIILYQAGQKPPNLPIAVLVKLANTPDHHLLLMNLTVSQLLQLLLNGNLLMVYNYRGSNCHCNFAMQLQFIKAKGKLYRKLLLILEKQSWLLTVHTLQCHVLTIIFL